MVMYALRPDTSSAPHERPVVDLSRSDEPDLPAGAFWANLRQDPSSVFRRPGIVHQEALLPYHERQATNLSYRWLAEDLHAVGWLERTVSYSD